MLPNLGRGLTKRRESGSVDKAKGKKPVSTASLESALASVDGLSKASKSHPKKEEPERYREILPYRKPGLTDSNSARGLEKDAASRPGMHRQSSMSWRGGSLGGGKGCPLPTNLLKHVFISHSQGTGGDQAAMLHLELEKLGLKTWYDQSDEDVTKEGMREGLEQSLAVLLFLSAGVLSRPFVQFEVRTAMDLGKPIILVHETDARHGAFDFGKEKAETPMDLHHLFDDIESIPFRRKSYERSAMLDFIMNKVKECSDTAVGSDADETLKDGMHMEHQSSDHSLSLQPFEKWVNGHTHPSRDCGDMVFLGGRTDKKAKYVRLIANSDPGRVRELLESTWGLKRPEVLLSITGGATLTGMDPHIVSWI
jgi:hypothetical protein